MARFIVHKYLFFHPKLIDKLVFIIRLSHILSIISAFLTLTLMFAKFI